MVSTVSLTTGKKNRLPRFRRSRSPPRMVVTPRDREILRAVYAYRVLTREQIERLLFRPENGQDHLTKTSRCRKRLKLLYHHGFLDRLAMPIGPGEWAWRPVYRLAPQGAAQVAQDLGLPRRAVTYWGQGYDRDHRPARASLLFLEHTLRTNDVRIAITMVAARAGYEVAEWQDDSELKRREMKDYVHVKGRAVAVVPDAHFVILRGDRQAHLLFELDRATMDRQRWKTKVLAYQSYLETGKYQRRYHARSLRILTVTTSCERLEGLRKVTVESVHPALAQRFWFTTFDEATREDVLSSPIWSVGEEKEKRSLIEPSHRS